MNKEKETKDLFGERGKRVTEGVGWGWGWGWGGGGGGERWKDMLRRSESKIVQKRAKRAKRA
jgi:hypothetical protein